MKRVLVVGAKGRVGSLVAKGVEAAKDLELAGAVDLGDDLAAAIARGKPDVAVDFTTPQSVFRNVSALLSARVHVVVGTTGMDEDRLRELDALARERGVACLVAPNFALGAVLMMRFAEEAARFYPWVEVVERHHEKKLDAPSGTASETARRIARSRKAPPPAVDETETAPGARGGRVEEVPVHSMRLPGSIAHQEVWFGGPGETLVIRHDTVDREVFVPGVLLAARKIDGMKGLVRGLEPLLWPRS
ncbi:MAG TPA: 4-hydroxy-tetrahydrodipicolinate reductase [Planctomycetota bacterium]|nr:4-hydroxy-tetrahydrodipicolinate reductase [Planctomycetota bacterium]